MRKNFLFGLLASSLALSVACNAYAGTRDLVFEDDEAETVVEEGMESISVKTTVLLTRDGKESTVLPSEEFKSGDKVKLLFTANNDGYVYWLAKGSSGEYTMLYPNAKAGMDNKVARNEQYTVPARGAFRFDDQPGNEELLCIFSTAPMPDLDEAARNQFKDGDVVAQLENKTPEEDEGGTRDLVFEDEEDTGVSTSTQQTPVGEPFVVSYTLVHK